MVPSPLFFAQHKQLIVDMSPQLAQVSTPMPTAAPATISKEIYFDLDFAGLNQDVLRDGIRAALFDGQFSPLTLTSEDIILKPGSVIGEVPVLAAKAEAFDAAIREGLEIQYIGMETVVAYDSPSRFPSASTGELLDTSSSTNVLVTPTTTTVASAIDGSSGRGGGVAADTAIGAAVGAVIGVLCLILVALYVRRSRASSRNNKRAALVQAPPFMLNNPMFETSPMSSGCGLQQSAASAAHDNAASLRPRGRAVGGPSLPGTVPDNTTNAATNDTDKREDLRSNPAYESQPVGAWPQFQNEPYGLLDNPAYGTARSQQQTCFGATPERQGAWRSHGATLADNPAYLSFADGPSGDSRG
jgi:hypothetical protein